tara:strand:- start:3615 stop:4313 length:699 start_codon:yes stop_codon:yes gene_type:complete
MREILITGHKGFIGKHLYELIKKDYNVTGIDKKDKLPDKDFDLVIHLAGLSGVRESWKKPLSYFYNNLFLSWKVFKKYKRVIYASSSTAAEPWRNPYALSKYLVEKISPKNSLGLRFSTVYGPGARKNMFVTKLIEKRLKYINIDCKRDFIHIQDILEFFKIIMKHRKEGIIEVGTGISIPLTDFMNTSDLTKRKSKFFEMKDNQANLNICSSIGFKTKINLKEYIHDFNSR